MNYSPYLNYDTVLNWMISAMCELFFVGPLCDLFRGAHWKYDGGRQQRTTFLPLFGGASTSGRKIRNMKWSNWPKYLFSKWLFYIRHWIFRFWLIFCHFKIVYIIDNCLLNWYFQGENRIWGCSVAFGVIYLLPPPKTKCRVICIAVVKILFWFYSLAMWHVQLAEQGSLSFI